MVYGTSGRSRSKSSTGSEKKNRNLFQPMEEEEDELLRSRGLKISSRCTRTIRTITCSSSSMNVREAVSTATAGGFGLDKTSLVKQVSEDHGRAAATTQQAHQEKSAVFLKAEQSGHSSRSMESLHRSFLTSSEKDVRRIVSVESLEAGRSYRRTASSEEEVERRRAGGGQRVVPGHLSLAPPVERKLTILSPGWEKRPKKPPQLPRLILPTPDQPEWMG
ncbi:hypothetical protein AAG570_005222 [Ranatra chinensis]|uniref:Uncharacterized protein n=1 Tax=Ranatra chinensis TaxID=642074 RepID=A0ABD0YNF1_9HEMI